MAAVDLFESFVADLSDRDRATLGESLRSWRSDLLAARSEDARVRLVSECMQEIRALTGNTRQTASR